MSEIKSNRLQIIELLKQRNEPMSSVEIAEELQIDNPGAYIKGEVERKEILVDYRDHPYGATRRIAVFRINPDNPPDDTLGPRQRVVKAAGKRQPTAATECSFALSSRGDLTISDGRKAIQLSADGTSQLIAYLDRINVDQVMKAAGVA